MLRKSLCAHVNELSHALVPCGKRQQGDVPGLLDGAGQTALVRGANTREPTRYDLAALRPPCGLPPGPPCGLPPERGAGPEPEPASGPDDD